MAGGWGGVSGCISGGLGGKRQPEIFGKPATDGVSAARRHFASQQSYGDLLFGDEPSPFHFGFQAAVGILQKLQPETRIKRF